jgi:uncharacterized protein (TIGR02145 family)
MKNFIKKMAMLLTIVGMATIIFSCNKKNEAVAPVISNITVTNISYLTAEVNVSVSTAVGSEITSGDLIVSGTSSTPPVVKIESKDKNGFMATLTSLNPNTTYIIKATATNTVGTSNGKEASFTTAAVVGTTTDHSGHVYHLVSYGSLTITLENFVGTTFNNNDPIPLVTSNSEWAALNSAGMCYLDNDPANGKIFGGLYNFFVIKDPRGIAPEGFHVMTQVEWKFLRDNAGREDTNAGGYLKQPGTSLWTAPNYGATNSSGLTALPGGFRDYLTGNFSDKGLSANWWSSTDTGGGAYNAFCVTENARLATQLICYYNGGFSIRFAKNQ